MFQVSLGFRHFFQFLFLAGNYNLERREWEVDETVNGEEWNWVVKWKSAWSDKFSINVNSRAGWNFSWRIHFFFYFLFQCCSSSPPFASLLPLFWTVFWLIANLMRKPPSQNSTIKVTGIDPRRTQQDLWSASGSTLSHPVEFHLSTSLWSCPTTNFWLFWPSLRNVDVLASTFIPILFPVSFFSLFLFFLLLLVSCKKDMQIRWTSLTMNFSFKVNFFSNLLKLVAFLLLLQRFMYPWTNNICFKYCQISMDMVNHLKLQHMFLYLCLYVVYHYIMHVEYSFKKCCNGGRWWTLFLPRLIPDTHFSSVEIRWPQNI